MGLPDFNRRPRRITAGRDLDAHPRGAQRISTLAIRPGVDRIEQVLDGHERRDPALAFGRRTSTTVARRSVYTFWSSSNCGPVMRSCADMLQAFGV